MAKWWIWQGQESYIPIWQQTWRYHPPVQAVSLALVAMCQSEWTQRPCRSPLTAMSATNQLDPARQIVTDGSHSDHWVSTNMKIIHFSFVKSQPFYPALPFQPIWVCWCTWALVYEIQEGRKADRIGHSVWLHLPLNQKLVGKAATYALHGWDWCENMLFCCREKFTSVFQGVRFVIICDK